MNDGHSVFLKCGIYCSFYIFIQPYTLSCNSDKVHAKHHVICLDMYLHISLQHRHGNSSWTHSELGHACRLTVGSHYQNTAHHPAISALSPCQSTMPHQLERDLQLMVINGYCMQVSCSVHEVLLQLNSCSHYH